MNLEQKSETRSTADEISFFITIITAMLVTIFGVWLICKDDVEYITSGSKQAAHYLDISLMTANSLSRLSVTCGETVPDLITNLSTKAHILEVLSTQNINYVDSKYDYCISQSELSTIWAHAYVPYYTDNIVVKAVTLKGLPFISVTYANLDSKIIKSINYFFNKEKDHLGYTKEWNEKDQTMTISYPY